LPWGKTTTLGRATGQNRSTFSINVNLSKLSGNRLHYHADNQFFGGSASRPSTLRYLYVSFGALGSNDFANGMTFSMRIEYKVKWSTRVFNDITGFSSRASLIVRKIENCDEKISDTLNALSVKDDVSLLREELSKLEIRKSELLTALKSAI